MLENGIWIDMEPFIKINSIVTPLDKVNVDTDQIVPKQFLKLVQKSGFGKFLFYNWRFDENEVPNSEFILNNPKYTNSKILVTGDNFGCGSSQRTCCLGITRFWFFSNYCSFFCRYFFQ